MRLGGTHDRFGEGIRLWQRQQRVFGSKEIQPDLWISLRSAWVIPELTLALTAPRIAPAGRAALVCLDRETYLESERQN